MQVIGETTHVLLESSVPHKMRRVWKFFEAWGAMAPTNRPAVSVPIVVPVCRVSDENEISLTFI